VVCASCAKSAHSFVLCLNVPIFQLYSMLNENFNMMRNVQYGGLEALWCLPYPVVRSFVWPRDHFEDLK
jgi:hypothetical protein